MTASYAGFVNGETPADFDSPVVLTTTAVLASPPGVYPIYAGGASDVNYAITRVNGTLTIAQAPLTITADSKSRPYGAPNPPLTASYAGFVNGETAADLDSPVVLTTTAVLTSPPGVYPIYAGGASDVNYAIAYVNGTLTITPYAVFLPVMLR